MTDDQRKSIERIADQYKGTPKGALETMLHTGAQTFENLSGLRLAIQRIEDAQRAEDSAQRERHHHQLTHWAKVAGLAAALAAAAAVATAILEGMSLRHGAPPPPAAIAPSTPSK